MTDCSAEKTPTSAAVTFSPESGTGRYRIRIVQSGFGFMISGKSFLLLRPGTVILTGTPAGVIMGQKENPQWLKAGDVFDVEIEGIGTLSSRFV